MTYTASETIPAFLAATVAKRGDEPALGHIRQGQLHWRTWREVLDEASARASQIQALGVRPGDCVAHVSENRFEWIITDLALHLAGAVHVPIHVTLGGEQIAEQIVDCGARLVFVSNTELRAKLSKLISPKTPTLVHDEWPMSANDRDAAAKPQVEDPPWWAASDADPRKNSPGDLATILYTSGTTGCPRGVMLSQRNLATNAAAAARAHGAGPDQTRLCILPLSHIYARTCDLYTWVYDGARLVLGESRDTLARDCQLVQPTALNAVPFLYQRIAEKIAASGAADQPVALQHFFGGRMERLTSGGAPLAPNVEEWYAENGFPVLQGYGLTEAAPVISVSTFAANRFGAVGRPLSGIEVQIAGDGEVLCRGANVMLGYWHNESATAEAIRDGWLHTGDLGELDGDNFLYIRGRKKELIVLSTGKKVLPTRVENLLTASPLIEQAAVFGDGQCGLVALIVPAAGGSANGEKRETRSEEIAAEIKRYLGSAAHEEQVHQFVLLDRPFSIERGEMTPKLSLCRKTIEANFAAELTRMMR